MPQDDLLFPWLNVYENALLPIRMKNLKVASAKTRIESLCQTFGLENHLTHYPWQLSGGLKQRAAFLRTCMTGSDILLLDEPFANLDALTRIAMQDWLREIKIKLNLTIVLVTHDISEALKLSNRILVMSIHPGRIINSLDVSTDLSSDPPRQEALKQQILRDLLQP